MPRPSDATVELSNALRNLPKPQTLEEKKVVERVAAALGLKLRRAKAKGSPKSRKHSAFITSLRDRIAPLIKAAHDETDNVVVEAESDGEESVEEEEIDEIVEQEESIKPSVVGAVTIMTRDKPFRPFTENDTVWSTPVPEKHKAQGISTPVQQPEPMKSGFEPPKTQSRSVQTGEMADVWSSPNPVQTPVYLAPSAPPVQYSPQYVQQPTTVPVYYVQAPPPMMQPATPVYSMPPQQPITYTPPVPQSLVSPSPSRRIHMTRPRLKQAPSPPPSAEIDAAGRLLSLGDVWEWSDMIETFIGSAGNRGGLEWLGSLRRLMERIKGIMRDRRAEDGYLRRVNSDVFEHAAERVVEYACITPMKQRIADALTECSVGVLCSVIRSVRGNTQVYFGITQEHYSETNWSTVVAELSCLDGATLPCDKLRVIDKAVHAIFREIVVVDGKPLGAYDLVPILAYALASADVEDLQRSADYVLYLCDPALLGGQDGYHLMCFQSALNVLSVM